MKGLISFARYYLKEDTAKKVTLFSLLVVALAASVILILNGDRFPIAAYMSCFAVLGLGKGNLEWIFHEWLYRPD